MKTTQYIRPVVLIGATILLLGKIVLNYPPTLNAEAGGGEYTLTIPASACIPYNEQVNWTNNSIYIQCDDAGGCEFVCPFQFPTGQAVSVKKLLLFAYDNASGAVHASLIRNSPGATQSIIQAGTSTNNSAAVPQIVKDGTITKPKVNPSFYGSFIWAKLDSTSQRLYGFKVKYTLVIP
jgi:hypothetical protein